MGDRVSLTVLLCEDDPQAQLVRAYLRECGLRADAPYVRDRVASREVHGGNVNWVMREFPRELLACRGRHRSKAKTLLIVVVDADEFEVHERGRQLDQRLAASDVPDRRNDDPLVILIPCRHVETWIRAALGDTVNESDDYKKPRPHRQEICDAGRQIHGWARDNPAPGPTCVPSLRASLPEWRRIG